MPIYELECTVCHNKVEKLFTCVMNFLSKEDYEAKQKAEWEEYKKEYQIPGYELIDTRSVQQRSAFQECDICGNFMELIPSLPSMQPDKYWSGQVVDGQYITSGSFLKRYRKQNNLEKVDRSIFEEVQKKSKTRMSDAIKQNESSLDNFLEKELASVEITPDAYSYKELEDFKKDRGQV